MWFEAIEFLDKFKDRRSQVSDSDTESSDEDPQQVLKFAM